MTYDRLPSPQRVIDIVAPAPAPEPARAGTSARPPRRRFRHHPLLLPGLPADTIPVRCRPSGERRGVLHRVLRRRSGVGR